MMQPMRALTRMRAPVLREWRMFSSSPVMGFPSCSMSMTCPPSIPPVPMARASSAAAFTTRWGGYFPV